ncbi:hypothetical protein JD969_01465 [Planctomycetota bacterium]|nr:hypothetical protein JD969_01465 [Planctomycetota bacterium]
MNDGAEQFSDDGQKDVEFKDVKQKKWPWYLWVPGVCVISPIFPLVGFVLAQIFIVDLHLVTYDWLVELLSYCFGLSLILVVLGLVFLICISSIFASTDERLPTKVTPIATAKGYAYAPFSIGLFLLGFGLVALGFAAYMKFWTKSLPMDVWHSAKIGLITSGIGSFISVVMWPYAKWLMKRFRRMYRKKMVCFECGYDLRGNADAVNCPECGAEYKDI